MKTNRFLSLAAIFAIVLTFFACSSDSPSKPPEEEPSSSSTYIANMCGDTEYDASTYRCESGELIGKCKGADFYPAYQVCNNGVIEDKNPLSSASVYSSSETNVEPISSSSVSSSPNVSSSSVPSQNSSSSIQSSSSKIVCKANDLGKGYDVLESDYINQGGVRSSVLDQDKLCQAGIVITDQENTTGQKFYIAAGNSITKSYKERNLKLGVEVNYFAGGFGAKFDTTKATTLTSQVYYAQLLSLIYKTVDKINTDKQNLKNYLTDEFVNALKSNKTPQEIFRDYGTHIFISYRKGGYLEANYTYWGTSLTSESDVNIALEARYGAISGSASSSDKIKDLNETANSSFNFNTYGGGTIPSTTFAQLTSNAYDTWTKSITATNAQICGINEFNNSFVPIWELAIAAGENTKATALQSAFNTRANELGIPAGRIFYDTTLTFSNPGTKTNHSITACPECAFVEAEIYALGAGGGGQGGDSTYYGCATLLGYTNCLGIDFGTGGAGGGGAATYAKLNFRGELNPGQALSFDTIAIGKGGNGGSSILPPAQNVKGAHSGGIGGIGGETKVIYKGARIIANGGRPGGTTIDNGRTDGGAGGSAITSSPLVSGNYYVANSGKSVSGSSGTSGDYQQNKESTGGIPATITGSGTISPFGGGNGVRRSTTNSIDSTRASAGGGGSGGFSNKKGISGRNGSLIIVLKYYKEEGKTGTISSPNINTPTISSSLLWDLSMGMGLSTGGGWYGYDDQTANDGYSTILFRDKTDNQFRQAAGVMEWDGGVSFSLDPDGFEYAYSGAGFAWLDGGATAPGVFGTHTGLCLEYSLSGGGDYYLKIATNGYTEDNEFKVPLPKQTSVAKRLFLFNDFEQGEGWGVVRTLASVKLLSVGMQIQGEAPLLTIDNLNGYTTTQNGTLMLKSINWDSCN